MHCFLSPALLAMLYGWTTAFMHMHGIAHKKYCHQFASHHHPPPSSSYKTSIHPLPPQTQQIVEAVTPARDTLDACLIFPSMPAVMKLNKLGSFSMAQLGSGGSSPIGDFMRNMRKNNDKFEENLLKLVRTLPKVCGGGE